MRELHGMHMECGVQCLNYMKVTWNVEQNAWNDRMGDIHVTHSSPLLSCTEACPRSSPCPSLKPQPELTALLALC